MILTEAQNIIANDTHRFRVLRCGRRFGKTTLTVQEIKGVAVSRPSRIAYIANNYQQARDIAWEQLKKGVLGITIDTNESRLEINVLTTKGEKSFIALRGWESVENLRGQAFDFLAIDEVAMMRNFWVNWYEVLRPTLTDRKGEAIFCSTPKGFNHFYDLCNLELTDKDFKSFHFTSWDNPHLPKEELEKAKETLPNEQYLQEYMASFQKTQGLVYKEFSREKHLYDELPKGNYRKIGGIDFGYRNPAAVLDIRFDGERFYVEDEWYKRERTEVQIAEYVSHCGFEEVYPDPENPSAIEELRRKNINVREVVKGKDSVVSGIQKVRENLIIGKLKINKRCVNLISEFEMYSHDDADGERNEKEKPIKANNHACFIKGTIINGKPIESIGIQTGVENVYEYKIAGESLVATPNHPILTHRGLTNIDALRYDDVVWKNKLLFMRVSGGIDIQAVKIGLKGIIIAVVRRIVGAKIRDYIDLFGKKKMELSLMDFLFITLTVIPPIILWIIYGLLTALNTLVVIGLKKSEGGLNRISNVLYNLLRNGLKLQLVGNSVEKWGWQTNILCLIDQLSHGNATYAGKNIQQKEMDEIDFATSTVVKKHYVGQEPVYNLKTRSGMYLANGIVVSNCDALRYAIMMIQPEKFEVEERKIYEAREEREREISDVGL